MHLIDCPINRYWIQRFIAADRGAGKCDTVVKPWTIPLITAGSFLSVLYFPLTITLAHLAALPLIIVLAYFQCKYHLS